MLTVAFPDVEVTSSLRPQNDFQSLQAAPIASSGFRKR